MTTDPISDVVRAFERDRYVTLPALLKEPTLTEVYRYARTMAARAIVEPGDGQVPGVPSRYGDFIMDHLLNALLPDIEAASGLKLFPTYSYFRQYTNGAVLKKHSDRPSCEISVTLCLGYEDDNPWPIWIEAPRGTSSVILRAGDGMLYRGMECPHWREAYEGTCQAQVFLHYVNQNGPQAEWKFDKRPSTTDPRRAAKP